MAYTRRYGKTKKTIRRYKPRSAATLSKKVKKILHRSAEHKQSVNSQDTTVPYGQLVPVCAGANTFIQLLTIAQGSDNSNRIGDQVSAWVKVKGFVRNTSAVASIAVRMAVAVDTAQSNTISANVVPVQSNIYAVGTDLFSDELIKQKRYNVIKEKHWLLGPTVSGSACRQFNFRIPKRLIQWTAGTAAATDTSRGHPYILFESEVASSIEFTFDACTYFTDI